MTTKNEILNELRHAMEFYKELGYEYLPVKSIDIAEGLKEIKGKEPVAVKDVAPSGREDKLKALRKEIGDCRRCELSKGRKNIVFGEGDPDARLMFIGEAPGREEDIQARPFVGEAGQILIKLINKMGFKREDVYITNIVKCMPLNDRNPQGDEIGTCRPFLEEQISIIKPSVIITLGGVSSQKLLNTDVRISDLRGQFFLYKSIPVMPTFHPAYLMRNPKAKWDTWSDAQKVLEKLKT
jgi:uracil-DNA glycosylase family 4